MSMSDDEYTPMTHAQCGETAFSIRKASIVAREFIMPDHVRLNNGDTPIHGDRMQCGSCGASVSEPYEPAHILHEQGFGTVYTSGVPVPGYGEQYGIL